VQKRIRRLVPTGLDSDSSPLPQIVSRDDEYTQSEYSRQLGISLTVNKESFFTDTTEAGDVDFLDERSTLKVGQGVRPLTAVPFKPGQMMTPDRGFLSRSHVIRRHDSLKREPRPGVVSGARRNSAGKLPRF
jgi:hypothetical protein